MKIRYQILITTIVAVCVAMFVSHFNLNLAEAAILGLTIGSFYAMFHIAFDDQTKDF